MCESKPVLLIEDDMVDILTVKRAFKDLKIENKLVLAKNGEEALAYLADMVSDEPCLILLDINMPKMNGIEFLKEYRKNKKFKNIPIVVVTTSKEDSDKTEMFKLSVSGYMIKPLEYVDFLNTIDTIRSYWTLSKLPSFYN